MKIEVVYGLIDEFVDEAMRVNWSNDFNPCNKTIPQLSDFIR